MNKNHLVFCMLALSLLLIAACGRRLTPTPTPASLLAQPEIPPLPTLDVSQVAQGQVLYEQHCAACHGANGEGQPDWQKKKADGSYPAPPHDNSGHTWHHADDLLINIITNGQQGFAQSQMPVYGDQLTDDEIRALVEYMKTWWGPEERGFQWRVTWQTQQQ